MNERSKKIFAALGIRPPVPWQNEIKQFSNQNPQVGSQPTQASHNKVGSSDSTNSEGTVPGQDEIKQFSNKNLKVGLKPTHTSHNELGISKSSNSEVAKFQDVQEDFDVITTIAKSSTYVAPLATFPQVEIDSGHLENPYESNQSKEVENNSETEQNQIETSAISFTISKFYDDEVSDEGSLTTKPIDNYPAANDVKTCGDDQQPDSHYSSSSSSSSSCSTCSESRNSASNPTDDDDGDPTFEVTEDCPAESSGSDESSVPDEATLNSKKRKRTSNKWVKSMAKKLRNSGKEYCSLNTGKLQPAKKMLRACDEETCRFKCLAKFPEEERQILFEKFWALGDLQDQRNFVLGHMQSIQPSSRRLVLNRKKNRTLNYSYFFKKNDKQVSVCFKFFRSTLGVSERFVRTVKAKNDNGFLEGEKRGLKPSNKLSDELTNGMRNHLASIPAVESHYVRANTQRKFIDGGKNLSDLYRDYVEICNASNTPSGKYSMYRHIFLFEYNMSFHSPKKDQCQICETFKNSNQEEKTDLEDSFKTHIKEKELSREEKNLDKTLIGDDYKVACFDLQAALPTPKGDVNSFYYKSRLNSYNFTVCQLEKKELGPVQCYFWHEGEGKRGSNEIGSCLLDYLQKTSGAADSQNLDIVLYSDNCGGQGKNKFIISAFLYAVANLNISSITHKFLVVGHGQNEGDASHSVIEKAVKKTLKNGPIYVPAQYATVINNAKKKGARFLVNELAHGDFYDLKNLHQGTVNNEFNRDSNGEKFNFNDISIIRFEKEHLDRFFFKTSYSDTQFRCVIVINETKTRKSALKIVKGFELLPAYSQTIPIGKKKFDDLQSLVKNRSIPRIHAPFYENLNHEKN